MKHQKLHGYWGCPLLALSGHFRAPANVRRQGQSKADMEFCSGTVVLFNHLVSRDDQRRRHGEAKCLGGLEIDGEKNSRGLLDR